MRHLALALGCVVFGQIVGLPDAAAAPDTWVSGIGVDAGNCPATAPCRSLQYALSRTRDGGIIAVQSSGSFAGVRINKSVTIAADGVVAILRTPGKCGAVVCIDTSTGVVMLRGLVIDPMNDGSDGVVIRDVRAFHLKHSIIRQARVGLLSKSPGSGLEGMLEISNAIITGNEIGIRAIANQAVRIAIDRVRVHNNGKGILFDDTAGAGTITAAVTDSVIAGHADYGIHAVTTGPSGTSGQPRVSVTLDRTAVLDNGQGLWAKGEAARVRIGNSTISGNAVALRSTNNGVIPSYGTNKLDGNGSGETPSLLIAHQ